MRLTQRGVALLAIGPVLLASGFGFGYPELAVLGCAALFVVVLGAGYAAWRPTLAVTRVAEPDRVMRGESSRVTLTVANTSRVRAATVVAYDRCGASTVAVPLLRLRPRRDTVVDYPVPTDRRGVVTIGPLQVQRHDPLGAARVSRRHGATSTVWVYPKVHPLTAMPVGVARSLDGRIDRVPHGSITFDTLREYVIGDELRHVHWRTTARVGELMVREHVDTSLPRLVILLDDRASAHTGQSFEVACEAAASIVVAAHHDELPLALQLVSGALVGGTGRRETDTREYLDLLAEVALSEVAPSGVPLSDVDGNGGAGLERAAARLRQRRLGDTLIYLTGPSRPEDLSEISGLRGSYPAIVVGALGGDDPAPSTVEGLLVLSATDGEEFAGVWDGVRAW
jgi:uncharacterized protein (DUF58 family)